MQTPEPWRPHPYQLDGLRKLLNNPGAGLFLDPGLGKTSITLAYLETLRDMKLMRAALVVAPLKPVYDAWPNEIKRWRDFNHLRLEILHGPKKRDALDRPADAYVINYDGLPWLEDELAKRKTWPFDVLVLDESTKVKNTNSRRFSIIRRLLPRFGRRVILTGSPAPKSYIDLFGQVFVLDGGARLGRFITHFRRTYFDDVSRPFQSWSEWVPKEDTVERITEKISDIVLTLKAEDHLKMPKLIENKINVKLPPGAMKTYKELEKFFIAELEAGHVTAANAGVKAHKLRQLASGAVYLPTGGTEVVHTAKLEALEDLLDEQSGQPLLVGVQFVSEVELIRRKFGGNIPYVGGGMSPSTLTQAIKDWNAGKLPIMLAHPASAAHGLNLQHGGHALCWYSLTWNLEEFDQFNRRLYRQGQTKPVVLHYLLSEGTVDHRVLQVLRTKDRSQRNLLDALRGEVIPMGKKKNDKGKKKC